MKYIIVACLFVLLGANLAFAAKEYIQGTKVADVTPTGHNPTVVYSFKDGQTTCYLAYIKGNKNTMPEMSCVK